MPYIKNNEKKEMQDAINDLYIWIGSKGDLNYAICELVGKVILGDGEQLSYTRISEFIDAVHDAECELRRRLLNKYEDKKIKENGDVPSFISILEQFK
jgi:hypothetical protein